MAITLTYNGTVANLGDRLIWTDEFGQSPVKQVKGSSTTGALLVHVGVLQAGRQITLDGVDSKAWIPRSLCESLELWAALPDITLTLVLRGVARQVMFDHERGAFEATPIWLLADGEQTPDEVFLPILRLFTTNAF
ncbi:hypothetical protein KIH07_03000 [Hydrogenophaga taeniospiralis]|uniref:hypothetical protein n=1 Tax=Hydrogenophaga taeniospiralis TaxID=65656 RepID=UPI001CF95E21|nr:hypothetical protein [Hydrogenophaga taeniospiralis]MCB4362684.1 hypothetical protein [Hydrogenophaga taeniospiralis]